VDPACRADRLTKFENSKMVSDHLELITCMYIIDVRASHYKINPPLLLSVEEEEEEDLNREWL